MARLRDGYQTRITFSTGAGVKFWEKKVTPPGIKGGGEINTTGMRNTAWRTKDPKKLKELSEMSLSVAYDPACLPQIYGTGVGTGMLQVNQLITVTFPDTHTLQFWGWLEEFTPSELSEGEEPLAEVKIMVSNHNNDTSGPLGWTEVPPVYT